MSLEDDSPAAHAGQRALVAIDLGAESCRVSLLRWAAGRPQIELIHRFPNAAIDENNSLHWNLQAICAGLEIGLRRCAELATEGIASIAVDGWAVDYVRLDAAGHPIANPFCYRDLRTVEAEAEVVARIPTERLRAITGIQHTRINTLHQLFADNQDGIPPSAPWINLPEYILHWLGGRRVSEYTNATHTELIDLETHDWSAEILTATGLDAAAAPPLVPPGTYVGKLSGQLGALPAFRDTLLIAPACHDTASAIAGIPATGDDWAYISSGTWSLVGTLLEAPCNSPEAGEKNFTNLGAAGGKTCFHSNLNGMWLLRQSMEQWAREGHPWELPELLAAAEEHPLPGELADTPLDIDDPDLLLPGDMPARINQQRRRQNLSSLSTRAQDAPQFARFIFESLSVRYAAVLRDIVRITGKPLRRIYVVGGGSQNKLLNRLTERATGLEVCCGAVESATLGNFAIQLAVLSGDFTADLGATANGIARWAVILSSTQDCEQ